MSDHGLIRVEIGSPLGGGWSQGFASLVGSWRLVRPRPNCDRHVADHLFAAGLPAYLPMARWVSADAKGEERGRVAPLFGGYVFAALVRPMPPCRWVSRVERIEDQQRLVEDLERLERIRQTGRPVLEERSPEVGDLVRVRGGALAGVEGRVIQRDGKQRLVVEIRCLGRLVSVQLGRRDVEQVEQLQ